METELSKKEEKGSAFAAYTLFLNGHPILQNLWEILLHLNPCRARFVQAQNSTSQSSPSSLLDHFFRSIALTPFYLTGKEMLLPTCNEHLGVVRFWEGHGVKAGVRRHLTWGEADVAYSHCQWLAAAPRGAEQGLLGHLAEASDDRHAGTWGRTRVWHLSFSNSTDISKIQPKNSVQKKRLYFKQLYMSDISSGGFFPYILRRKFGLLSRPLAPRDKYTTYLARRERIYFTFKCICSKTVKVAAGANLHNNENQSMAREKKKGASRVRHVCYTQMQKTIVSKEAQRSTRVHSNTKHFIKCLSLSLLLFMTL